MPFECNNVLRRLQSNSFVSCQCLQSSLQLCFVTIYTLVPRAQARNIKRHPLAKPMFAAALVITGVVSFFQASRWMNTLLESAAYALRIKLTMLVLIRIVYGDINCVVCG